MRGKNTPIQPAVPGVFPGGCLVLVAEGQDAPKALLAALASRGLAPSTVHDEPAVMTALAGKTDGRRVLVVVEPEVWPRLDELLYAVGVYHGDVLCWQFKPQVDASPQLSALKRDAITSADGANSADEAGPIGQILGRPRPVDALLVKVPGLPASSRDIVTPQELSMLLGPAPGAAS